MERTADSHNLTIEDLDRKIIISLVLCLARNWDKQITFVLIW